MDSEFYKAATLLLAYGEETPNLIVRWHAPQQSLELPVIVYFVHQGTRAAMQVQGKLGEPMPVCLPEAGHWLLNVMVGEVLTQAMSFVQPGEVVTLDIALDFLP